MPRRTNSLIMIAVMLFNCSASAKQNKLLVTGSSTVAPLMLEISKAFEKDNKDFRVDVQTGGSSRGISDQRRGLSQLGMVSRALKEKESDLTPVLIARDGIGIIVHKNNSLKNLNDDQVVKIYRGEIKNWKEFGWKDAPIVVVNKAEGRSTLEVFLHYFKLKNSEIKASVVIGDNEQGIKTVSGNPYSIGYVSIGTAEYNINAGLPIRALSLNGKAATVESVRKGEYPVSRELNLVLKGDPSIEVKKLIAFAKSKAARSIIEQFYFVPISH